MAEVPLVVVNAMRAGPSTGMPTKMEQADLNIALYGGHGEAPRIVLAARSVRDCFYQAMQAFYLSETFQMPVILLVDQSLSHRTETLPMPDLNLVAVVERLRPLPPAEFFARLSAGTLPPRATLLTFDDGTREVWGAVLASTLTTIAVFLPLFSLTGLEGKMFSPLAITITFALIGSLLLSLTVIPVLASFFMKTHAATDDKEGRLIRALKFIYLPLRALAIRLAHSQ